MKIVVTGSLGNIGRPLTKKLVRKGHPVIVISRKTERMPEIEALGAEAAIGSMENVEFLTSTYEKADIVYTMEALAYGSFFDKNLDFIAANTRLGRNHKEAIEKAGIKQVVHLSSIGAHTNKGIGILEFHHNVEKILQELPDDVSIKFMRPVGFYYNMFQYMQSIQKQGAIIQNYGGNEKEPWVSTLDIADVIAEEIEKPFGDREVRYIASDEVSPDEVAQALGEAIGKPDLEWITVSDGQMLDRMISTGMNPDTAKGFVEMNAARQNGILYEDYYRNRPVPGKVKMKDFAGEFAKIFHQK